MDAVILAAGFGKRLGKYTENVPKTLLKINKQDTILSRLIKTLKTAEIEKICIITGFQAEYIKKYVKDSNFHNVKVIEALNYEQGPIFTFRKAREIEFKENFLLIPSDIIIQDKFLGAFIRAHETSDFGIPYTKEGDLDKNNILYINEEDSIVVGFNKPILQKPHVKVTPIPTVILNSKIFRFVDLAIKLKHTRVIDTLNLGLEHDKMILAKDFSGVEWLDVDTTEIYENVRRTYY